MREGSVKTKREKLPDARTKIWSAIRMLKKFDFDDLERVTEQSYPHVRRYVRRLLAAGYLRLTAKVNQAGHNEYRLVRDTGPLPPMPRRNTAQVFDANNGQTYAEDLGPTARDKAWEFMRQGKPFRLADLIERGVQQANAYKFLAGLLEAGYLKQVQPTRPGPGGSPATYQLIRDTGELAPVVQRNGSVYDPNLEEGDGEDEPMCGVSEAKRAAKH